MTTFIADFIFGKRDRRPRSRPSPAARLMARFRPAVPQQDAAGASRGASSSIDTGSPPEKRPVPAQDLRPGLRP